ncbi:MULTISPECIES: DNA sulfur modification protein DndD [unclassified Methanoregula]|uniref:DNA sulfur modification protein DndD n=1 Tax=unclassified Methanoregula TaxID=2649730 RepID=UPI0009D5184C|nr:MULTISPECIES: DNA sulfur modification protein DndD [unclassified Methanoregula]OPX62560.1 MAG: DNA double-strand break repair Rad50 ATPase [Methanoregula sp. PtaB.Bin085]OPY31659.1 MAG: DNA double-strand break repair Rad50 ATPase [Methanoregula sp. PtaU1.Bin006]
MQLHSLTLENVRIFRGKNVLDFTPAATKDSPKPIILIGGKNGAGKTTLFESILLCLYGQHSPGSRLSNAKYEEYIRQMVPRGKTNEPELKPAIEVAFDFTHSGLRQTYHVRREWELNPNFSEKLTIRRNGEILHDIEADQWQDLLNELIPPRFARLFLFDGEKIQNLVEDTAENVYLKESFKSLLGLDLVDRLKADLGIYLRHNLKGAELSEIEKKQEEIQSSIDKAEHEKESLQQERAQVQTKIDQIRGEVERQEQLVAGEGGSFARKREDLKKEKTRLDHEVVNTQNEIRELCAGLFPFSISPAYCKILKEHLIEEDAIQSRIRSQEIIHKNIGELNKILESPAFWSDISVAETQKAKVRFKITSLLHQQLANDEKVRKKPLIHHVSQHEYHQLMKWIDDAISSVPEKMIQLSETLEKLTAQRTKTEEKINKAPSDDIIGPYITKLNELNQNLGKFTEQLRSFDERIHQIDIEIIDLKRRLDKVDEEIQGTKGGTRKADLIRAVTSVLNEYSKELQQQKINQLGDNILSCFNRLNRKDDYVRNILIDDHYNITLFEPDGHPIPKDLLSAGEKEIFAVSLLWGLTLTSGRQLPFIIDTPLGRLDSEHRGNLVMDFFQHAGDQMIIFSTDTEIDKEYFRVLQPHIARAYHLDYSKKDRVTTISPGYFWQEAES